MKSSLLTRCYLLIALVFFTGIVNATNYYVDPSSTVSTQNGAQATPWKTLSQVQSNMSLFQAGDFIYFKRGQTFSGTLNITKSGTALAPITFATYGTATEAPIFTSTSSNLFTMMGRQYIVFDGFKITDLTLDPNDRTLEAIIDIAFYIDGSNYITIKNCDISLVGVGINMVGDNNTMDHCTIGNLRMIRNTVGGDDDYGANPVVISGANNNITSNYFKDCWAYSYDYTYDGGAIEMYGAANNGNKIMYNTAINCDGFMEIGFSGGGATNDNIVAYNKIINCGELVYISNSGTYATAVSNLQFYNNAIVHTVNQLTMPTSMIGMSTTSTTANIVVLKNNIFWLTTGIDVARPNKFTGTQLTHEDNIYHLGTGSVLNYTVTSSELTTAAAIFTSTTSTDPSLWNYAPVTGSPAIDFGQNVGLTKDFAGNTVPSVPNAGILESGGTTTTPLSASATSSSISCNGGSAPVTVSASGGTGPYTGTGTFTVTAGTYTYTVTDAAGATATATITVTQASAINVTVASGTIATFGGTTTITVSASGGAGNYTYSLNGGTYQSSAAFSGVAAGTHTVTVKDANGCTSTKSITITQPGLGSPLVATATAGTISCNGSSTTVTVSGSGGTAPYTGTGAFTVTAGTYTYTITGANGVTASTSITISQPTAITATLSAGTITTAGGTTTITVSTTGGTPSYTYQLNTGAFQTSNIFTAVPAGDHTITIKDKNNCSIVKTIRVNEPVIALTAASTAGTINCNGGSASVTVSATGGTAPYTGTGTFTVTAGTYSYTVTDATGTTASTSITVTQPTALSVTVAAGTVTSASGTTTATVTAAGGTSAYSYSLDGGTYQTSNIFSAVGAGAHSVTVKDAKGCTAVKSFTVGIAASPLVITVTAGTVNCYGSSTTVTVAATGGVTPYTGTGTFTVTAGTYTYTVTDAAGTTGTNTVTVNQPALITGSLAAGTITTTGGTTSITVSATGGSGFYTYSLDNSAYQSASTFTGVAAGTHTVIIKDSKGCSITKTITVTQTSTAAFKLLLVSKTNETCKGKKNGTIKVTGTGGTTPYTYKLNNGAYSTNNIFTGLRPGWYIVTGKSANGATSSIFVIIQASNTTCTVSGKEPSTENTGSAIEGLKINAYPNPTSDQFSMQLQNADEKDVNIVVMNLNGEIVYKTSTKSNQTIMFGRNFTSGMYIAKITQGDKTQTVKLVKAK